MKMSKGVTLVELMIVVALLSIVAALSMRIIVAAQRTQTQGEILANLEEKGRLFTDKLQEWIPSALILTISNYHSSLRFQIPVDPDGDGSIINPTSGYIDWGARDANGVDHLNWSYVYKFVPEVTNEEWVIGVDINEDGDLEDTFLEGRIERDILNESGIVQQAVVVDRNVVLRKWPPTGAIDWGFRGTPNGDPLFVLKDSIGQEVLIPGGGGVTLTVNIWHGQLDISGNFKRYYLKNVKSTMELHNPQL